MGNRNFVTLLGPVVDDRQRLIIHNVHLPLKRGQNDSAQTLHVDFHTLLS
jgi:hypothetical protein